MPPYLELMQMSKIVQTSILKKIAPALLVASLSCTAVLSLQGCVAIVVGGAVMGTLAATDRRTLGAQTEDKAIVLKGDIAIRRALGDTSHVNVNSFNRLALLSGEVTDEAAKQLAEKEIRGIQGVQNVQNEIVISEPSKFGARSNDTLLTTKVKTAFIETKDVYGSAFKVVTEAGTVFLMGRVTHREGDLAASVASGVNGVRKVVKIFEYITEDELRSMLATKSKINLNQDEQ
jgi:osmotically-inducible protein OsmY